MKYRREIDGLRALAVVPVILFHADIQCASGGYIGVDIFFVISGYLITSIILAEKQAGTFTLLNFYERRARRILPALFAVIFACLPVAWLLFSPADMKTFSKNICAVMLFISNIALYRQSGYCETAAELKPLLHTWSLAVEEQYYLFFPALLLIFWKFGKQRIFSVLALIAVASLAIAQFGSVRDQAATFYLLPTRFWELLMGAFLAATIQSVKNVHTIYRQSAGIVGLLLITYAIVVFNRHTPFPSLYALIPTLGTSLIILFATQETFVGKWLGNNLLVGIGRISYSAYLWHQPLLAFARYRGIDDPRQLSLTVVVSLALAYLSWKFIETPFRNRNNFNRKQIFTYCLSCGFLLFTFGLTGCLTNGFINRLPNDELEVMQYESYNYKKAYREGDCFLRPEQTYNDFSAQCTNDTTSSTFIWGDSHAAALSFGLRQLYPDLTQYTASECPPIINSVVASRPQCKDINDHVMEEIKKSRPGQIFLHANWILYKEQEPTKNIEKTIDYIHHVSPRTRITVIGSVPQWKPSLPNLLVKEHIKLDRVQYLPNPMFNDLSSIDQALHIVAKKNNAQFVSAIDELCRGERCQITTLYDGIFIPTAWDYGHLTEGGSLLLAKKILTDSKARQERYDHL